MLWVSSIHITFLNGESIGATDRVLQLLHSRLAYLNCASLVIFYEQSRAAEACQAGT